MHRRRLVLTVLAVAFVAPLGGVDDAAAGLYKVYGCRLPSGAVAPTHGWIPSGVGAGASGTDSCVTGGGLRIALNPNQAHQGGDESKLLFTAPADTRIVRFAGERASQVGAGQTGGNPMQIIGVDTAYREQCAQYLGCTGLGSFATWNASGNKFAMEGLDTSYVYAVVVCIGDPNSGVCPAENPSAVAMLFRSEVTLFDSAAPQLASISGPLTQPGPHHSVESATVNVTDRGSGVYRTIVEVDGVVVEDRVVDDNGGKCADAVPGNSDASEFLDKQPCKLNATGPVSVDTRSLGDGDHTLQVSAIDAAGNTTRVYGPTVFRVDNHSVGTVANGINASDTARLILSLPARVRRGQAIPFKVRTTIRGRLVNGEGQGIGNAELELVSRNTSPGARRSIDRLRTNPDGTFAVTLPRGRPSRTLRFVYRARLRDPREAAAAAVTVRVRAGVRMAVSPRRVRNRQSVTFSGRLLGGSIPKRGKLIEVQVRFPTGWRTFATVRTRRSGSFHYRYRFLRSFDPVTYRFRVRARSERSFPYETGVSRVVSVRVR